MLILASSSPRRREILQQLGIPFLAVPSAYEETNEPYRSPVSLVCEQSLGKALEVAQRYPHNLVLGADTLVTCGGRIMGKPTSHADACMMLHCIQGGWHEVYTGVALVQGADQTVFHQMTAVHLCPLTTAEIEWYVNTGEPFGKAGSYGIQGLGGAFVEEIRGCYFNVMGLPIAPLFKELRKRGGFFPI